jgi:hypothetical protein
MKITTNRKAKLQKDSTYYILNEGSKSTRYVAFAEKNVTLIGGVVEGRQSFVLPSGKKAFASSNFIKFSFSKLKKCLFIESKFTMMPVFGFM